MLLRRFVMLICFVAFLLHLPAVHADDSDDNTGRDDTQTYPITDDVTMLSTVNFSYAKPKIVIKTVMPTLEYQDDNQIFATFNDEVAKLAKNEASLFRDLVASAQGQQAALPKNKIKNNLYNKALNF